MDINYLINQGFEIRSIELRQEPEDSNSRIIKGTAIVFDSESELMRAYRQELNTTVLFREIIKPQACTMEFLQLQDIIMLYNHQVNDDDITTILARNNRGLGNLTYTVDAQGVHFEFEALPTPAGDSILQAVRSRIITACSFCFQLNAGGETWVNAGDGTYIRYINSMYKIHDFSLVTTPAYPETTVNTRGLIEFIEGENRTIEVLPEVLVETIVEPLVPVEVPVEVIEVVEELQPVEPVEPVETPTVEADVIEENRKLELDNYYAKYKQLFAGVNLN